MNFDLAICSKNKEQNNENTPQGNSYIRSLAFECFNIALVIYKNLGVIRVVGRGASDAVSLFRDSAGHHPSGLVHRVEQLSLKGARTLLRHCKSL